MKHLSLLVGVTLPSSLLVALACSPSPETKPERPSLNVPVPTQHVYDVSWRRLVGDRQTASAYTGQVVRFRLTRADVRIDNKRTLRAWYGDRLVSPTLVVSFVSDVPDAKEWLISGICEAPVVDGIRRGPRIDFWVPISNAVVVNSDT